jgi:hypothetical protein
MNYPAELPKVKIEVQETSSLNYWMMAIGQLPNKDGKGDRLEIIYDSGRKRGGKGDRPEIIYDSGRKRGQVRNYIRFRTEKGTDQKFL